MGRNQPRGLVEWLAMLLPAGLVAIGLVVSYVRLEDRVSASCETFSEKIKTIQESGTKLSSSNATQIVRLEEKFNAISDRLEKIEAGQNDIIAKQMEVIKAIHAYQQQKP